MICVCLRGGGGGRGGMVKHKRPSCLVKLFYKTFCFVDGKDCCIMCWNKLKKQSNVNLKKQLKLFSNGSQWWKIFYSGHDKMILCLAVAHVSVFNTPHLVFFYIKPASEASFVSLVNFRTFLNFLFDSHSFINTNCNVTNS